MENYEEALNEYELALQIEENYASRYNIAVVVTRWKGLDDQETQECLQVARAALENADDSGRRFYGLAGLEALQGNYVKGIEYLKQALTADSENSSHEFMIWAKNDLAWKPFRDRAEFLELLNQS